MYFEQICCNYQVMNISNCKSWIYAKSTTISKLIIALCSFCLNSYWEIFVAVASVALIWFFFLFQWLIICSLFRWEKLRLTMLWTTMLEPILECLALTFIGSCSISYLFGHSLLYTYFAALLLWHILDEILIWQIEGVSVWGLISKSFSGDVFKLWVLQIKHS